MSSILVLSGSLENVLQIGVEFHDVVNNISDFFAIVVGLYKLGFVTIAWEPNMVVKPESGPFAYFEIVFRRSSLEACNVRRVKEDQGVDSKGHNFIAPI